MADPDLLQKYKVSQAALHTAATQLSEQVSLLNLVSAEKAEMEDTIACLQYAQQLRVQDEQAVSRIAAVDERLASASRAVNFQMVTADMSPLLQTAIEIGVKTEAIRRSLEGRVQTYFQHAMSLMGGAIAATHYAGQAALENQTAVAETVLSVVASEVERRVVDNSTIQIATVMSQRESSDAVLRAELAMHVQEKEEALRELSVAQQQLKSHMSMHEHHTHMSEQQRVRLEDDCAILGVRIQELEASAAASDAARAQAAHTATAALAEKAAAAIQPANLQTPCARAAVSDATDAPPAVSTLSPTAEVTSPGVVIPKHRGRPLKRLRRVAMVDDATSGSDGDVAMAAPAATSPADLSDAGLKKGAPAPKPKAKRARKAADVNEEQCSTAQLASIAGEVVEAADAATEMQTTATTAPAKKPRKPRAKPAATAPVVSADDTVAAFPGPADVPATEAVVTTADGTLENAGAEAPPASGDAQPAAPGVPAVRAKRVYKRKPKPAATTGAVSTHSENNGASNSKPFMFDSNTGSKIYNEAATLFPAFAFPAARARAAFSETYSNMVPGSAAFSSAGAGMASSSAMFAYPTFSQVAGVGASGGAPYVPIVMRKETFRMPKLKSN